ncbi:MAG: aminotransferase class IV family protein [Candidatus Omnitrophica bacterium]|nr:aminotransferase class IV family protein [Candidatus Omnitrophota bacterium]
MKAMQIAYLNGKFMPLNKTKVPVLDRGFLYGDGAFETMRAYNGTVFLAREHVERLSETLKKMRIRAKIKTPEMLKIVNLLLKRNGFSEKSEKDAYIKIIVTRGKTSGLLAPSGRERNTVLLYALPYRGLPERIYIKGIKAGICPACHNEKSGTAGHKTLNYLNNILCLYEAKNNGFDDTILLDTKGFVAEASGANIFLVKRNNLFTPPGFSGILPGITRKEIMRIAARFLKLNVKEKWINLQFLRASDEIFITNSLIGILPVVRVGEKAVGKGGPGPVTKALRVLFKEIVNEHCEKRS